MSKPSVLIVEGDTNTLRRQGLCRAEAFADTVRSAGGEPDVWTVDQAGHLIIGRLKRVGRRYDAVMIVGHGNPTGIVLANGLMLDWDNIGQMLAGWHPRALGLVSCSVGRSWNARRLFEQVPSLVEVLAPKTVVSASQADLLGSIAFRLVRPDVVTDDATVFGQIAYALTGGLLAHYKRDIVLARTLGDQLLVSLGEELLLPVAEDFLAGMMRPAGRR